MEGNKIIGDGFECVGESHNVSQMLETFDGSPKFDRTLVTLVAQVLKGDSKMKSDKGPLSVKIKEF